MRISSYLGSLLVEKAKKAGGKKKGGTKKKGGGKKKASKGGETDKGGWAKSAAGAKSRGARDPGAVIAAMIKKTYGDSAVKSGSWLQAQAAKGRKKSKGGGKKKGGKKK